MATAAELRSATEESTSREVTVNGQRIHYNEIGAGDPMLCIHGGGPGATGWSNFKQNIGDLARDNRMLMIDMPGWGRSEYEDTTDEWLRWIAGVLAGFLDALGIDKVDIIGNSMGGQAGLMLALLRPERVKHLVLIGSQPTNTITVQAQPLEALNNIVKYYGDEGPTLEKMQRLAESLVYDTSHITPETVKERYDASTTPEALEQIGRRIKQPRADLYFELEKNIVPTLIVWGIEDKGGALEVGLLMLRRFQNARMHIFQRCGHWAQVEHQDEFDELVLQFFKS
jgi:pimeloyl-ACP methyl ester carboxylesterase